MQRTNHPVSETVLSFEISINQVEQMKRAFGEHSIAVERASRELVEKIDVLTIELNAIKKQTQKELAKLCLKRLNKYELKGFYIDTHHDDDPVHMSHLLKNEVGWLYVMRQDLTSPLDGTNGFQLIMKTTEEESVTSFKERFVPIVRREQTNKVHQDYLDAVLSSIRDEEETIS